MKKKAYFDVIRIIAIFLVLMNHQPAYKLYYSETGICEILALIEAIIIRINVPLFAMVSGALLLGREESLCQLWKKRITRILWVILIFSALLYLELGWLRHRDISISEFIYGLMAGDLKNLTTYWFLYAYMGYLLMLPFLRKIARGMSRDEFLWLMGIHIVFCTVIPLVNFALQLCNCDLLKPSGYMNLALSNAPLMFYPLIGYYINERININSITTRWWQLIALACCLGLAITASAVFTEGHTSKFSQNYLDLFSYVNIIAVFLVIKKLFGTEFSINHVKTANVLSLLASLVFGIYLLDLAVQLPVYNDLWRALVPTIGKFAFSLVWICISFVAGGTVTFILKKLPFFKTLL